MYLTIENLSKTIKGAPVLQDINLSLDRGKVYGLRGKNGSGKTMLMRAIAGLIRPTAGCVKVNGQVIGTDVSFPPSIGLLLENPAFIGSYTGFKNLQVLAGIQARIDDEKIRATLEAVGLDPHDRRPYRKYSLGMKQRLGVACAVMEDPGLVLLDEPTNALDPAGVAQVRALVSACKQRGALVLVACHDADELDLLADEVYTMAEGRIVDFAKGDAR